MALAYLRLQMFRETRIFFAKLDAERDTLSDWKAKFRLASAQDLQVNDYLLHMPTTLLNSM